MSRIKTIVPADLEREYHDYHFAPAVEVDGVIHVSGVIGVRADGTIPSDPREQFDVLFANLAHLLEEAGSSAKHVAKLVSYHIGLKAHLLDFSNAKDAVIGTPYPAWTAVGTTELFEDGALVEVEVIAVRAEG